MPPYAPTPNGSLRLGTYRSIWTSPEVEVAPALKFLAARQIVELNPADAAAPGRRATATASSSGADGRRVHRQGAPALRRAGRHRLPADRHCREESAAELPGGGLVEITRA